RRHLERLAEEALADGGVEAGERAGLEDGGSERVRDEDVAGADRVEQAGDAERRVGAELDRIAVVAVQAAQDRVHAAEAAQRLQVDGVAADDEVLALDEREAEVAREERVLEVRLVVRAG